MTKTEYLKLSAELVQDLRRWIEESRNHHGISTEHLLALNQAAEIIDQTTVRLAAVDSGQA
jgi:hypothetical protein